MSRCKLEKMDGVCHEDYVINSYCYVIKDICSPLSDQKRAAIDECLCGIINTVKKRDGDTGE